MLCENCNSKMQVFVYKQGCPKCVRAAAQFNTICHECILKSTKFDHYPNYEEKI